MLAAEQLFETHGRVPPRPQPVRDRLLGLLAEELRLRAVRAAGGAQARLHRQRSRAAARARRHREPGMRLSGIDAGASRGDAGGGQAGCRQCLLRRRPRADHRPAPLRRWRHSRQRAGLVRDAIAGGALPVPALHHRCDARHLPGESLRPLRRGVPELAGAGRRLVRPSAQAAGGDRRARRLQRHGDPPRPRQSQHLQRSGGELRRPTATWSSPRTITPSPSPASATASRPWKSTRRASAASRGTTRRSSCAASPIWCTPATRRWARPSPATRNGTTSRPTPTRRCRGAS